MNRLLAELESKLSRETLVFPSEVAAEFWRRQAVRSTRAAVREDRFISWDTFKETAFDIRHERVPANRTVRIAFAEQFIRDNKETPVLKEMIPEAFAKDAEGFSPIVEAVLPRLPAALTIMRGDRSRRVQRLRADLEIVQDVYSRYMDDHGLFEPRWLQTARRFRGGEYLLVAPELADDFPEFQPAVSHLNRISPSPDGARMLKVYPDVVTELRLTVRDIGRSLEAGTDPEDIYVTLGDFESDAERLSHEAQKYDVPITLRSGRMLSDSSIGRMLVAMRDLVSTGFSVYSLELLLMNNAVPWQDPAANAELILHGIRRGALGFGKGMDRKWTRVEKSDGGPSVVRILSSIRNMVPRVVNAASFAILRDEFNVFLNTMVVRTGWRDRDERVLARCQDELRALVDFEADTGIAVANPFSFWCNRLAEHPYVPQKTGVGVQVLAYRVGALVCPLHHFVVGANHAATAVVVRSLPFLSDADRTELESELSDRDLSQAFLNAYSDSGRTVTFSAARRKHNGSVLLAGYFVSSGRVEEISADELAEKRRSDPYVLEQSGLAGLPTGLQAIGAAAYSSGLGAGGPDFTSQPVDGDVLETVLARLQSSTSPGLLRLSSSSIDRYRTCPFWFLLERGLGLDGLNWTVDPDDPAELGKLYHDILATFFNELAEDGMSFESDSMVSLRARLLEVADRLHSQQRGMIPGIVYEAKRPVFDRIVDTLLEHDAVMIDGHEPLLVEAWQREQESAQGYVLVGRVDRVTRAPDGSVALVDYKKSKVPAVKLVNAGSGVAIGPEVFTQAGLATQVSKLGSVQIPLYVRLLESGGVHVTRAGYYSLEHGRYVSVFDHSPSTSVKSCMNRERLDEILQIAGKIVESTVHRINAGHFECDDQCSGCPVRAVCRTRYHVR